MMGRVPFRLALVAVLAVALVGCGSDDPPRVAFHAAGAEAETAPVQYCEIDLSDCSADPAAAAMLRVPPGGVLDVMVPGPVAETPWQVVFRYRPPGAAAEAAPIQGRSEVFAADERDTFALRLPAGAQLETAEVQQFGAPAQAPSGAMQFPVRGTWVLSVDDR